MILPINAWHLEVTSRCTLACPRCPRTLDPKMHNKDLELKYIQKFFTPEIIQKAKFILFCGNFGDPIYHPEFHNIIKYFKNNGSRRIKITTNGFGRSLKWWSTLSNILDHRDIVNFSIDGLQDTNHLYRVNSKWDSVYKALEFMAQSNINTMWKFIVFKHNQHQIEEVKSLATKLGVTKITIAKSRRWESEDDPLKPDEEWCNPPAEVLDRLEPKCTLDEEHPHFISATGFYAPCCWYGGREQQGPHYFNGPAFNIKEHSLEEILNSKHAKFFERSLTNLDDAHDICKIMCRKEVKNKEILRNVIQLKDIRKKA